MRPLLRYVVAALAIASAGCYRTGVPREGGPRRSANTITGEEISATQGIVSVYDAIQRLRPQWITSSRSRSSGTQDQLIVYFDSNRYGSIESLRQFPIGGITDIIYLNAAEATNRFGTGHSGGAIVITMSRQ
ncbi:MAG TPA: hypothetical protein VKH19_02740 [Gemmatimonadaceae bacterium]|nr:hypothetical protein [Gemmatimonadaceae bacterium]